jgi:hypothetical protein
MWKKIELLENHSNFRANEVDIRVFVFNIHTVHDDSSRRYVFQKIDASEKRALAGTARTDDDQHFPRSDVKIDSF